jgi:hypothetical protein
MKNCILMIVMLALTTFTINGCGRIPRPLAPPAGAPIENAWGAVPLQDVEGEKDKSLIDSFIQSLQIKRDKQRQTGESGKIPYRALTLSGGGSRGAYGAGVLSGWTVRGDRPQFDVVTGISTGALMATHVFLGSEFDNNLTIYKRISNNDVFREHSLLSKLRGASLLDTTPLRSTLMSMITEVTLDLVAAEYRKGRRLFIGTTNLDANLFVIWDMGLIADSERPDRLKRYIDVVMASAAFPVAFPPVYLEIEGKDGNHTEMHGDGSIRETVFFFDFDLIRAGRIAMNAAGFRESDFQQELYLMNNGPIEISGNTGYKPVEGKIGAIAKASISSLMTKVTQGSTYRMWILAMLHGADFHMSFVPSDFEFTSDLLTFDPEEQSALFDLGYQQAINGTAWAIQRAPADTSELLLLISDQTARFDSHEMPAWLKRGDQ